MLLFQSLIPSSYRSAFVDKVKKVASSLQMSPDWLMLVMNIETAGTFSPSITNALGYTGLIQFGSAAAQDLGTTTAKLRNMSAIDQLDYVEKYYKMWYKRLGIEKPNTLTDSYLLVLFPAAVNKGDNFVIETNSISAKKFAQNNPLFDSDKDLEVKVKDVKAVLLKKIPSEWFNDGSVEIFFKAYKKEMTVGLSLISAGILIYFLKNKLIK